MSQARHDVAIVGGGATGLFLGCLLALRGADIVVLERRTGPTRRNRAIGIHAAALDALDLVGLGTAVRTEAAVIRRGVAMCRGRQLGALDLDTTPVRTLPQHRTEALLAERLEQLAPGRLRRGETVTALQATGECVTLRTGPAHGEQTDLVARYVVGADGIRSTIRAAIGAEWRSRGRPAHYVMADERAPGPSEETAILHLEPDGVVERFPPPRRATVGDAALPPGH